MKRLILIAALVASTAQAQVSTYITGQELYRRMQSSTIDQMMAMGYVAGVADAMGGITICIPPNQVTLGQLYDMVKQSLENTPSERHKGADLYVNTVLANRWPCAQKKSGAGI